MNAHKKLTQYAIRLLLEQPEHHGHADQVEAREMARAAIAKAVGK